MGNDLSRPPSLKFLLYAPGSFGGFGFVRVVHQNFLPTTNAADANESVTPADGGPLDCRDATQALERTLGNLGRLNGRQVGPSRQPLPTQRHRPGALRASVGSP